MAWDPTDKIVDFGEAFESMLIPATSDAVLGEDDPGGTPVAISAMASFAGQAFGKVTSNLQFIKNQIVTENTTIEIGDLTELAAAQTQLDQIQYINDGVNLTLQFTASLSGTSANLPLSISGIGGPGGIITINSSSTYTIDSTDGTTVLECKDVDARIAIDSDGAYSCSSSNACTVATFERCRNVITALEFGNSSASGGDKVAYSFDDCQYVSFASTYGTGYANFIQSTRSNLFAANLGMSLGPSGQYVQLTDASFLRLDNLDFSHIDTGAGAGGTSVVVVDETSDYRVDSYGTAGVITVTTGATYALDDLETLLSAMPKRLDTDCTIKLPAAAMIDTPVTAVAGITIEGFWSPGNAGSLTLEGNTVTSSAHKTQDSTVTISGADHDGIEISNCTAPIIIDSIMFESDARDAMLIVNSTNVTVQYCYFKADDEGVNVSASSEVIVAECVFGDCGDNGIMCYRSQVYSHENEYGTTTTDQPADYGYNALEGGIIGYKFSLTNPLAGILGTTNDDSGGVVRG